MIACTSVADRRFAPAAEGGVMPPMDAGWNPNPAK